MKAEGHRASWEDSYREKECGEKGQGRRGERINAQLKERLRVYVYSHHTGVKGGPR